MLAVIKTGGKQYLVKKGDKIKVEKLPGKEGSAVKFDTLLTTDEKGVKVEIGKPLLKSKVEAKILKQDKDKKLVVVKYKSKTRYTRRIGHRQPFSLVEIEKI
ncbi:MAG: 50S ribosomal protein L21 [Parcubacteria group bacterium]|nr:50S ribosomal protein L21 [Parcubacteria group bacterium]|tara:strand:- start:13845 stop:14150 length:306 start_codon:yes stop_codon:yes gene_type:complete